MARPSRYIHDALLGYVHRPRHCEPGLTIDSDGLRSTGQRLVDMPSQPILAVGDSFTFGEGVRDLEAWPAQLQRLSGRPVLNGGVSGYGFDQIVLRAEQLAAQHRPSLIVVGFIAEDIQRIEMRRLWRHDKPWFALEGDALVPKGLPVSPRARQSALARALRSLGAARPLELLLRRLGPRLQDRFGYHVRVQAAGTGEAIACRLTERLAALQRTASAPVLLVAQYDARAWDHPAIAREQRDMTGRLLDCGARNGLGVIDSYAVLAGAPKPRRLYRSWHMNEAGHLVIARLVAAAPLVTLGPGSEPPSDSPTPRGCARA